MGEPLLLDGGNVVIQSPVGDHNENMVVAELFREGLSE